MVSPLKRRDMGLAGAIIVLSQAITGYQSSQSITKQVAELREDLLKSKLEMSESAKKSDLEELSVKFDRMAENLISLKQDVSNLRRNIEDGYTMTECSSVQVVSR